MTQLVLKAVHSFDKTITIYVVIDNYVPTGRSVNFRAKQYFLTEGLPKLTSPYDIDIRTEEINIRYKPVTGAELKMFNMLRL